MHTYTHTQMRRNIRPAEQFLRDVSIRNVGRVFALAPSIMTFDVATELVPKMRFLDKVCTMRMYHPCVYWCCFVCAHENNNNNQHVKT